MTLLIFNGQQFCQVLKPLDSRDSYHYFQAFKQHKLHDPLEEPGSADLTADVDFSYLQQVAGNQGKCLID